MLGIRGGKNYREMNRWWCLFCSAERQNDREQTLTAGVKVMLCCRSIKAHPFGMIGIQVFYAWMWPGNLSEEKHDYNVSYPLAIKGLLGKPQLIWLMTVSVVDGKFKFSMARAWWGKHYLPGVWDRWIWTLWRVAQSSEDSDKRIPG